MQTLETRLDSPRVVCNEKATAWQEGTDWSSIVYLKEHDVECPQGLFLTRFQLKTTRPDVTELINNFLKVFTLRVSYHYRCCKFIL